MITDVFYKRYPHLGYSWQEVPPQIGRLFRQGAQIIFQDLKPHVQNLEKLCQKSYGKLVRELGHGLHNGGTAKDICIGALCEPYDLWNNAHGPLEQFIMYRLSLLELLLSDVENELTENKSSKKPTGHRLFGKHDPTDEKLKTSVFRDAIIELIGYAVYSTSSQSTS